MMIRVLAVEDSPTQRAALTLDLERIGFRVAAVSSGPEALQRLQEEEFDVVVSDVVMMGMDGYELCRQVKSDPRTETLPVVLLTSLKDPLDVVSGLQSGADNFLRKPYQADHLAARLRAAVDNRDLRRAGALQDGIELSFLDRQFTITSDRQQILDLLISTFEELVVTSREVRAREADLAGARVALERELHAVDLERSRLQAVVDAVPVALFVLTPDGVVSHASEAMGGALPAPAALEGRRLDDVLTFTDSSAKPLPATRLPHHVALTEGRASSAGAAFDVFLAGASGVGLPVVLHASPVLDRQRPVGCVGTVHVLGALTRHDPVTRLPNSAAFLDRASGLSARAGRESALMLLELDRFDVARAAIGHAAGAEVLVEVAGQLRRLFATPGNGAFDSEAFLGYLGGGRFGVLLADLPDSFSVLHMAESARRRVAEAQVGAEVGLTASVGVAFTDRAHGADQVFGAASTALRRATALGGDRVELFGRAASVEAIERLELEVDLRAAITADRLELHYQPEVDLATGRLIGFEALARWQHPSRGLVPPSTFIGLAEQGGMIGALGGQLLRRACAEARSWDGSPGDGGLTVAVNVSALQLRQGFPELVAGVLDETGLAPSRLVLEVTETAAMSEPEVTAPVLADLRELGVRLALDDFGTGYSSLAYLTTMRFDQLKLDKGFVDGIHRGEVEAIVPQSIIALGRSLGVPVLAEGIEHPQQVEVLRRLGCDQGQGYLFSRPLGPDATRELLSRVAGNRPVAPVTPA